MSIYQLPLRLKRLRQTHASRAMLQETRLHPAHFIAPLFIKEGLTQPIAIKSMPGHFQLPLHALTTEIETLSQLGIQAVLLFGIPSKKNATGCSAWQTEGIIQQAIRSIKKTHPHMLVITDLCFCEYTDHGQCGILKHNIIDNDTTLEALGKQAISHAQAGADWVAPSGMADGMVQAIRQALDEQGYHNTVILSYAVKYCSSFYSPFREAAEGAPRIGDRKNYQMNPANAEEAIREAALDIAEGADLIMVKPAQYYCDIIFKLKQQFPDVPLCAYQVSGEFAMLKFAAAKGLLDETQAMLESLYSLKRAKADLIITYFAKDIARWLQGKKQ